MYNSLSHDPENKKDPFKKNKLLLGITITSDLSRNDHIGKALKVTV